MLMLMLMGSGWWEREVSVGENKRKETRRRLVGGVGKREA
jgi:hypothetical protein